LQSSPQVPPAMKSTLLPLAAAAALFLGFSAPASAADDYASLGKAGGWNIIANSIACLGGRDYANGTTLSFAIRTDGNGRISIWNDNWSIPKGKYPVTLSVDRVRPVTFEGETGDTGKVVSVWWKLSPDEINLVSYGAVLNVTVGKAEYQYRLVGSEAMLKALVRCAADRMSSANPFADAPSAAAPPATNPFPETASNPYRRM
jgi:hypothetical protein